MCDAGVSRGAEVPDLQAAAFWVSPRLIWVGWTGNSAERAQYVPSSYIGFVAFSWILVKLSFNGAKVQKFPENAKEKRKYFD